MAGKIWITACGALLLAWSARPAAAFPFPEWVPGFQQECAAQISNYLSAFRAERERYGGSLTAATQQQIEQGMSFQGLQPIEAEHQAEHYEEEGRTATNAERQANAAYQVCGWRYEKRMQEQRNAQILPAQQQPPQPQSQTRTVTTTRPLTGAEAQRALADMQKQMAEAQAMMGGRLAMTQPDRPATPRRSRSSENQIGATQKRGEESDPANPGDEKAPAQIANQCVSLIKDPQAYGGFKNSCDFPVYIAWCAWHPKKGAWSEAFDCDKDKGGLGGAAAHASDAEHTHNAEKIFWFACRKDATPRVKYTPGSGFYGHCQ